MEQLWRRSRRLALLLARPDHSGEYTGRLEVAWTYRTGDASHDDHKEGPTTGCGRVTPGRASSEATLIIAEDRLYPAPL
jgi:hypothetical protein